MSNGILQRHLRRREIPQYSPQVCGMHSSPYVPNEGVKKELLTKTKIENAPLHTH